MPIKITVSGMPDNKMRAKWALDTIKHFHKIAACGLEESDDETVIVAAQDLLTDIFHLLVTLMPNDCCEIDLWEVVQKAMDMYLIEVKDEEKDNG